MELSQPTDCLVLKIIEFTDSEKNEIDTTLYILFDTKNCDFIVRGKRSTIKKNVAKEFNFTCNSSESLIDFISIAICKENLSTYIFYNYDNLPFYSNNITFDFLNKNFNSQNEIAGYEKLKYSRKRLTKYIDILKSVFNFY